MGFKMGGWSAFTKTIAKEKDVEKEQGTGLLPSEMEGTNTYKGDDIREKLVDVEDRIEFIKEDIFSDQDGKSTNKQSKDIAAMEKRIAKLRAQKK